MKKTYLLLFILLSLFFSCKKNSSKKINVTSKNSIEHAKGLSIYEYDGFSIVKITNPWPNATKSFTYVLNKENHILADSLKLYPVINVPLKNIVVTSTTIIPYLELLGVENKLIGFPHTNYISSAKTRKLIDAGKVVNLGQNEQINFEKLIALSPELIVPFGVDNSNPTLTKIEKNGLKVLIQGDWMEQTPLGKAEWIKLYGALFGKEKEAKTHFDRIVSNYKKALELTKNEINQPTMINGYMYQNQWFVAKGDSWIAQFIKDAKGNYLWKNTKGTGSLALSFEKVFEVGNNADIWISGDFKTLKELDASNPHYKKFKAFQTGNVYTFENLKGATGGVIYYELGPSRPDLILKDYLKIIYPNKMKNYSFTFAHKLE